MGLIALTFIFLVAGGFLILYIALYNTRKKRHLQERQLMEQRFEQELIKSQMEVQEQTLKTIGRDIHDNIGQLLSLTKLTLGSVRVESHETKAQEKVNDAVGLIDSTIKELRHLASILHPTRVLIQGLEKAIEAELEWLSKSEKFTIYFNKSGHPQGVIGGDRELIVFRIIQEALNNAIRHAGATAITLLLEYDERQVQISIVDNGKGFDPQELTKCGKGLGLQNFSERARLIQGAVHIESKPEIGTQVHLSIPYT